MKRLLKVFVCFVLVLGFVPMRLEAKTSYSAYKKVVKKLEKKYGSVGTGTVVQSGYEYDCLTGVAYLNLIDINADGSDELIVYYKNGSEEMHKAYTYEVYTMKGKKAVKAGSGDDVTGIQSAYSTAITLEVNGNNYFVVDQDTDEYFYTIEDYTLTPAVYFGLGMNVDGGSINGETVSSDEFSDFREEWLVSGQMTSYSLVAGSTSDLQKTIDLTDETREVLGLKSQSSDSTTSVDGYYKAELTGDASGVESMNIDGNVFEIKGALAYSVDGANTGDTSYSTYSFVLTEDTEFLDSVGVANARTISKDDFVSNYCSSPDLGVGLIVKVKNGVVESISVAS